MIVISGMVTQRMIRIRCISSLFFLSVRSSSWRRLSLKTCSKDSTTRYEIKNSNQPVSYWYEIKAREKLQRSSKVFGGEAQTFKFFVVTFFWEQKASLNFAIKVHPLEQQSVCGTQGNIQDKQSLTFEPTCFFSQPLLSEIVWDHWLPSSRLIFPFDTITAHSCLIHQPLGYIFLWGNFGNDIHMQAIFKSPDWYIMNF